MYAQLVDAGGRTLAAVSTRSKDVAGEGATGNVEAAKRVGKAVAELARRLEIGEVVFHRNGFLYPRRGKARADAAREAGLRFEGKHGSLQQKAQRQRLRAHRPRGAHQPRGEGGEGRPP